MDNIRQATLQDAEAIQNLIGQLGFDHSLTFISGKLEKLLKSVNDLVLVYEDTDKVIGLITLYFSVQLAFEGDIMTIGYMVVDESYRSKQIGKKLEEYATKIAKDKKCSMIEVYSQAKRTDAHRFYKRQGYVVAEKFFSKTLGE